MPATSKHQQRAMCMALAARKGDLKVGDLKGAALEIYKSDMTNKQIEDFTVLKEMRTLQAYLSESLLSNTHGRYEDDLREHNDEIFDKITNRNGEFQWEHFCIDNGLVLDDTNHKKFVEKVFKAARGLRLYQPRLTKQQYLKYPEYLSRGTTGWMVGIQFDYEYYESGRSYTGIVRAPYLYVDWSSKPKLVLTVCDETKDIKEKLDKIFSKKEDDGELEVNKVVIGKNVAYYCDSATEKLVKSKI